MDLDRIAIGFRQLMEFKAKVEPMIERALPLLERATPLLEQLAQGQGLGDLVQKIQQLHEFRMRVEPAIAEIEAVLKSLEGPATQVAPAAPAQPVPGA